MSAATPARPPGASGAPGRPSGVLAALVTPVDDRGAVDLDTFDRLIDFVVERGVDGVCVGGATSEYPHFELDERKALLRHAGRRLPAGRSLIAAIGASSFNRALELGACALEAGSGPLLVPMPWFLHYQQGDLEAYCRQVSRTLRTPCLLYHLPDFTSRLDAGTIIRLLETEEFIVGVKDSSGDPEALPRVAAARDARAWTLLVGDDRAVLAGLEAGWDGVISGAANVCPELFVALHRSAAHGEMAAARRYQQLVDALAAALAAFPAPWGIRIGLQVRGIDTGPLPLPLSAERRQQIARFQQWLRRWLAEAVIPTLPAVYP